MESVTVEFCDIFRLLQHSFVRNDAGVIFTSISLFDLEYPITTATHISDVYIRRRGVRGDGESVKLRSRS